jgi:hypothetical protein
MPIWRGRRHTKLIPPRLPQVLFAFDGQIVVRFRPSGNPETWGIIVKGVRARHVSPN